MDKERFKVPKSVQQAIPIQQIWPDGIFQQGTKFSKTYRFTDINYYIASKDNKTEMFLDYSETICQEGNKFQGLDVSGFYGI